MTFLDENLSSWIDTWQSSLFKVHVIPTSLTSPLFVTEVVKFLDSHNSQRNIDAPWPNDRWRGVICSFEEGNGGKRYTTRLVNSKNDTYTLAQLVVHIYFGIIGAGTVFTMQHIGKYWITVEVNGQQAFPQAGWTDETVHQSSKNHPSHGTVGWHG